MSRHLMPERAPPPARIRCALGLLLALLALAATTAPAAKAVPAEFWGLSGDYTDSEAEWATMQSLGVGQFRHQFSETLSVAGYDIVFERSARHGITILPMLYGVPGEQGFPVKGTAAYESWRTFVTQFAQRYGTNGTFWRLSHDFAPRPVKAYEIWNEPNRAANNPGGASVQPHHYARFLIDTAASVRTADASAAIVVGGLDALPAGTTPFRQFLNDFYEGYVEGGAWGSHTEQQVKAAFEGVGFHPYSFSNEFRQRIDLAKERVTEARSAISAHGDGAPLWLTEFGWAVIGDNLPTNEPVSNAEQARLLREIMTWFRDKSGTGVGDLNIRYAAWYLYRDVEDDDPDAAPCTITNCWQNHAGLYNSAGARRESACAYARLTTTYLCGFNTATYAEITQILHGQPGYVGIDGHVNITDGDGGEIVNNAYVNINFERWNGSSWVYVDTAHANVVNGYYHFRYWSKGVGRWRLWTGFQAQGPYHASRTAGYHQFQVKSGYRLVSRSSGKCLSLTSNSPANNTPMVQWTCSPSPSPGDGQVFTLVPMESAGNYVQLKINSTGKCVDVYGANPSNGGLLVEYECVGAANQQWDIVPISGQPPYEALLARHTGKCMDVPGGAGWNGAQMVQWDCYWDGHQQWYWQTIE